MNVAELFATLGIDVDEASFALADAALARVKQQTQTAAASAELSHAISAVVGDSTKAMNLIGFEANNVMEAHSKRSIKWIEALSHAMTIWRGVVAGAVQLYRGAKGVAGLVDATAKAGAHADELSQKLGISAEAVQELGYAAGLSGSSTDGLADGLAKLSKNADLAKGGSKEARKAFKGVGIDVKELLAGGEKLDGFLEVIAERFAAMPDGAEKSNLAIKLFGKSGKDLIPFLNNGADGIKRLRAEAQEMGAVIDNDTSKALEGFGDETDKVKLQLAGLRNDAIKAVLPELLAMAKGAQAWIKANRVEIIKAMTAAIKALIVTIKVVAAVARGLVAALAFLHDHGTVALATILALAAGLGYLALGATAAWIAILGPIAAVVVAIVALGVYWDDVAGIMFAGFMKVGEGVEFVEGKLVAMIRGVRRIFTSIANFFRSIVSTIRGVFRSIGEWITARINWVIGKINWAIRQANRLPGVNIGTLGAIGDSAKSGGKTAAVMPDRKWIPGAMGPVPINVGANTTINVNAPNANAEEVAAAVDNKMRTFWDRQMRETMAGSGVA
jgi:hypothetical protein